MNDTYGLEELFTDDTVQMLSNRSVWQVTEIRGMYLGRCFLLRAQFEVNAVDDRNDERETNLSNCDVGRSIVKRQW